MFGEASRCFFMGGLTHVILRFYMVKHKRNNAILRKSYFSDI